MTWHCRRGFTLVELLVALLVTVLLAGVSVSLLSGAARASVSWPVAADQQQRLRAGFDQIVGLLTRAGQGLTADPGNPGALPVPVLYPQRRGVAGADADVRAFDDRVTVVIGTDPPAWARLAAAMATPRAPVPLEPSSCPPGRVACGFGAGNSALVADARATGEWFTIAAASPGSLDHAPPALLDAYDPALGAMVMEVDVRALAFDAARRQLRLISQGTDLPWLDRVASFEVAWFGNPAAPRGPRPPPGSTNCVVGADGAPLLSDLAATDGSWVRLRPEQLSDGPWCGRAPWRFDADLYRVRFLRLRIRFDPPRDVPGADALATGALLLEAGVTPPNLRRMP